MEFVGCFFWLDTQSTVSIIDEHNNENFNTCGCNRTWPDTVAYNLHPSHSVLHLDACAQ